MKRVEQMYAYVVEDPEDNTEGIPAFIGPLGPVPMVGADAARIRSLKPRAQKMATALGRPITLVRFEIRTELETIDP
jgi:hypothetical protein